MISTLPNMRRWWLGEFRDDIQFIPKYQPPFLMSSDGQNRFFNSRLQCVYLRYNTSKRKSPSVLFQVSGEAKMWDRLDQTNVQGKFRILKLSYQKTIAVAPHLVNELPMAGTVVPQHIVKECQDIQSRCDVEEMLANTWPGIFRQRRT